MLRKLYETNDKKFLAKVRTPAKRRKYIRQMNFARTTMVPCLFLIALLTGIAEGLLGGDAPSGAYFFIGIACILYVHTDLEIRHLKLISLIQQEAANNTPKTD